MNEIDAEQGIGKFDWIAGQNNVEWNAVTSFSGLGSVRRFVPIIHVHHPDYGEYKHVMIYDTPEADALNLQSYWVAGNDIVVEWRVRTRIKSSKVTEGEFIRWIPK